MSYFGLYVVPYNSLIKREHLKTLTAIYISQRYAKNKNSKKLLEILSTFSLKVVTESQLNFLECFSRNVLKYYFRADCSLAFYLLFLYTLETPEISDAHRKGSRSYCDRPKITQIQPSISTTLTAINKWLYLCCNGRTTNHY